MQQSLTSNSEHFYFWNDALKKLSSIRFDASDQKESTPLSLKNFIHDIQTVKHLWTDLSKIEGVKFLSLRHLNRDPLENFFGQIRAQSGLNTNPDCNHFVSAYKTLLINNISTGKSLYTNCATDDDVMLGTLTNLTQHRGKQNISPYIVSAVRAYNCDLIDSIPQENVLQTQSYDTLFTHITGAICRCLLPKLLCADCDLCKNALLSNDVQQFHSLIAIREYCADKKSLFYPSKNLDSLVWESIYLIDKLLTQICNHLS